MFWAICSDMRVLASQEWPFVMGIIWVNHLVGGLEHVLFFHSVGNNHPNWVSYFSEGWLNHQPVINHGKDSGNYQLNYPTNHTWWLIPLSKWVITPVINGISRVNPLITGVITHLLSGMSHQVVINRGNYQLNYPTNLGRTLVNELLLKICRRAVNLGRTQWISRSWQERTISDLWINNFIDMFVSL